MEQVNATVGTIDASTDSQTLLSASRKRKGFRIYNDSIYTCYVKYGTTASTTDYSILMPPGSTLSEDIYNGRVDAIWSAVNGKARVTELY